MLEALGSRPNKPRLRGVSAKRATPRTAASELRSLEGTAPYHYIAEVQHFPDDLPTDVQKHNIGRENFVVQTRRVDTWQRETAFDGDNPRLPPYAVGDIPPVRDLQPPQISRARTPRQAAGVATLRDTVGAPTLGGASDFGMLPAPQARILPLRPTSKELVRPVSRDPQARGTSTMTPLVPGDGIGLDPLAFGPPRGADAAFKTPVLRPRSLYETPRMMKQRGLRSAPVALGFNFPNKMNPLQDDAAAQDREEAFAKVQTLTEYYPLRSAVLNAQYKVDDASHIC